MRRAAAIVQLVRTSGCLGLRDGLGTPLLGFEASHCSSNRIEAILGGQYGRQSRSLWQDASSYGGLKTQQEQEPLEYADIGDAPSICGVHMLMPELAQVVLQSKRMRLELPDFTVVDLVQPPSPEELPVAPAVSFAPLEEPCTDDTLDDGPAVLCIKRTYNPSNIIRKRRHGYLARVRSRGGRNVMNRRRTKGRWRITA